MTEDYLNIANYGSTNGIDYPAPNPAVGDIREAPCSPSISSLSSEIMDSVSSCVRCFGPHRIRSPHPQTYDCPDAGDAY